jgi:phospholipid transport system substrate-binding protein
MPEKRRMMMKKLVMFFALVLATLGMSASVLAVGEDPYKLIQRVAETTFKRIATDQAIIKVDPNHLKVVVSEELMPYINHRLAAKMVLGKSKATKEQKKAFYVAFKRYLITTYATVFTKYTNQKVVFEPARAIKGKKVVTVKTRIKDQFRPDIHIDFKVRLNKKTGIWKAYDMVAEGISLLNSKKAELKSLLRQRGGVVDVTRLLNEKAKLNIKGDSAA